MKSNRKMFLKKCLRKKSSLTIKEEIKSYYKDRFKENLYYNFSNDELRDILSTICTGRCPRNMEYDNDTIRKTINEIMDQVLY